MDGTDLFIGAERILIVLLLHLPGLFAGFYVFSLFSGDFIINFLGFILSILSYMVCLSLVTIILYRLFTFSLKEGVYDFKSKEVFLWGSGTIVLEFYNKSFTNRIISSLHVFPHLFYKLLGAKISVSVKFGCNSLIIDPKFVEIGENTVVGGRSCVCPHFLYSDHLELKKIKVGRNCVVGGKSCLSPGCVMEDNSVLAVGSVLPVDGKISKREVWGGIPAKKLK